MTSEIFYIIEKILDRKKVKDKYQYLIKWQGYPEEDCTWEPIENLQYSLGLVKEYNKAHPTKKNNFNKAKKTNNFLNKKRKNIINIEINDNEFQIKNKIEEKKNTLKNDETICIDKSLISVLTVQKYNEKLMAIVNKIQENGEKIQAYITTEELMEINPWILLDFYESNIQFS